MPNLDSSPPDPSVIQPPEYPNDAPPATPSLGDILRSRIALEGPMRFADFMEMALYHPALGYYARESHQVGREGDFFASVSVGPLFGEILAHRFLRAWQQIGSPARWRIIESGAHDGSLARDVLTALAQLSPEAFSTLEYVIPEPLPRLQERQRATLQAFEARTRLISTAHELRSNPLPGIAFGNELLDALPFHLVEWEDHRWHEVRVGLGVDHELTWEPNAEITDPKLLAALAVLGSDFPAGYRTEVRTCIDEFLEPLTHCLMHGLMIWLDYGFARPEFYHPSRKTGTLRTFCKHRAADNPLVAPGEMDITAHVDFTAVAECARHLGGRPLAFRHQGSWLTEHARDWLIAQEGKPTSALRQFHALTHPAHLGGHFHVIELTWSPTAPPISATDLHRLALQACPSL